MSVRGGLIFGASPGLSAGGASSTHYQRCRTEWIWCDAGRFAWDVNVTCLETCEIPVGELSSLNSSFFHPLLSKSSDQGSISQPTRPWLQPPPDEPLRIGREEKTVRWTCPDGYDCAYWSRHSNIWQRARRKSSCESRVHCEDRKIISDRNMTCIAPCEVPVDLSSLELEGLGPFLSRASNETISVTTPEEVSMKCPEEMECVYRTDSRREEGWQPTWNRWGCSVLMQCENGQLKTVGGRNVTCSETVELPQDFSGLNITGFDPFLSRSDNKPLRIGLGRKLVYMKCAEGRRCAFRSARTQGKWMGAPVTGDWRQ
uniref:Uncharacterized protein n=1 Tax=Chromera velia CCMP2878 TaxID=1169474 RepID=A0A0G4F788_9ALVE|eukprot:Cvel_15430.t1-p1 / transcript=Cvel_15430.t1 / gene=Cvel_15430 / organism=Chromera_velia_CCMP2878 / gene_product=hypothetical protein / transcript_product=hypothetical protein / location=Cvel_scaffold1141:2606-4554(-) / protein_length=314 / sequence_SO=supercontig / SO=protein_coding / is_pseudo=false